MIACFSYLPVELVAAAAGQVQNMQEDTQKDEHLRLQSIKSIL